MSASNPFFGRNNHEIIQRLLKSPLTFPNRNAIIQRSPISGGPAGGPAQNNNGKSSRNRQHRKKYIISAHGSVFEGFTFQIPSNINLITLVKVGYGCPPSKILDDSIIQLYKNGNTLFLNDDTSTELTVEGRNLLLRLKETRQISPDFREALDFRNHIGRSIANEMFLCFVRDGSREGNTRMIGIKDLLNNSNKLKNVTNLTNSSRRQKIDQILLSSLLNMYYEADSPKVFIISACRNFQRAPWAGHNFAGEISRRSNSVPSV